MSQDSLTRNILRLVCEVRGLFECCIGVVERNEVCESPDSTRVLQQCPEVRVELDLHVVYFFYRGMLITP